MTPRFDLFAAARDVQIRRFGADITAWWRPYRDRLLGLLAARGDQFPLVIGEVAGLFREVRTSASVVMRRGLSRMALWAHAAAADRWARTVPPMIFARRALLPGGRLREAVVDLPRPHGDRGPPRKPTAIGTGTPDWWPANMRLGTKADYQAILDGLASPEEARALVRQFEFPPPSAARVEGILQRTAASDGLSAMERIKTVLARDLGQLQQTIVSGLSDLPEEGAVSALDRLSRQLRPFIADDEGINYKARRIARTESVRVCETMLREADSHVADLYTGLRWQTAEAACPKCEPYSEKVFWQTPAGGHVADDGEPIPDIPLHPNCLCWTTPEMREDIEALLPPAKQAV